jgi:DNA repair photolyase
MKDRIDVGFTIATFSSNAQEVFEPHVSSVGDRISALRKLNEADANTWVFIAPILPYVTEEDLELGSFDYSIFVFAISSLRGAHTSACRPEPRGKS